MPFEQEKFLRKRMELYLKICEKTLDRIITFERKDLLFKRIIWVSTPSAQQFNEPLNNAYEYAKRIREVYGLKKLMDKLMEKREIILKGKTYFTDEPALLHHIDKIEWIDEQIKKIGGMIETIEGKKKLNEIYPFVYF